MSGASHSTYGRYEQDPMPIIGLFAVAAGVFFSAPALLLGMALAPLARRARAAFAALALLGAAWVALMWDSIIVEMHRAHRAGERAGMFMHVEDALAAAWPHVRTWWLLAAPFGFCLALALAVVRRRSVEELRERDERRAERVRRAAERKARRKLGVQEPPRREAAFELGRHVSGDKLLKVRRGRVFMPLARLGRTLLVIGAPGSGKTITLGRLAHGVATTSDWQVVVIDAKGDPATQRTFAENMRRAGRSALLFPQEAYDAWRGSAREIAGRLIQLIDWADEGGGAYYRDLSVNLVRLACTAPGGPPRSSSELLRRLDKAPCSCCGRDASVPGRSSDCAMSTSTPAASATARSSTPPPGSSTASGRSRTRTAPTCCSTSCCTPRRRPS